MRTHAIEYFGAFHSSPLPYDGKKGLPEARTMRTSVSIICSVSELIGGAGKFLCEVLPASAIWYSVGTRQDRKICPVYGIEKCP